MTDTRIKTGLIRGGIGAAAVFFAVAAVAACVAFASLRVAVPVDLRFDREPVDREPTRELRLHADRSFVPPLTLAARKPAHLMLGPLPRGAELTLVGWRGAGNRYAVIDVVAGDRHLGFYNGATGHRSGIVAHSERFRLSRSEQEVRLTLTPAKCPYWVGFIVVQDQPRLAAFARWALPFSSALLLVALAWTGLRGRFLAPVFALVLATLYWHTLATAKVAPIADYFFSDSLDFVMPLTTGQFTSDMAKHLLFFPLARGAFGLFAVLGLPQMDALAAVFVLFGVANALLAWAWMRRMLPGPRSAALLAVAHAFSFAPWAFAAHFETYAASAAAAHAILWLLARGTIRTIAFDTLLQAAAGGLAALMHPPLLVLSTLGILRFPAAPWRERALRALATVALAAVVFGCGSLALRKAFGEPVDKALLKADTSSAWSTFQSYAHPETRTAAHLMTVANGQFAFAFAGARCPVEWETLGAPLKGYAQRPSGWLAGLALAVFWIGGLSGAWADRRILSAQGAGAVLVVLPTLVFYWLFNPSEMLLYSPPLVGALLVGLAGGWIALLGEARALRIFALFALLLAVHNGLCLGSFP